MVSSGNNSLQRGFFNRLSFGRRQYLSLRMAPMIDIIFLLLIFFLVASRWRPQEGFLPLKLSAAHAEGLLPGTAEPLEISILETSTGVLVGVGEFGQIKIEKESVAAGLVELTETIEKCLVSQRRFVSDPVEIICEPGVKSEYWIKIYNVMAGVGLNNITFVVTE